MNCKKLMVGLGLVATAVLAQAGECVLVNTAIMKVEDDD